MRLLSALFVFFFSFTQAYANQFGVSMLSNEVLVENRAYSGAYEGDGVSFGGNMTDGRGYYVYSYYASESFQKERMSMDTQRWSAGVGRNYRLEPRVGSFIYGGFNWSNTEFSEFSVELSERGNASGEVGAGMRYFADYGIVPSFSLVSRSRHSQSALWLNLSATKTLGKKLLLGGEYQQNSKSAKSLGFTMTYLFGDGA